MEFARDEVFVYNYSKKLIYSFVTIFAILILLLGAYFAYFQSGNWPWLRFFTDILSHIKNNIASSSILGVLYTSILGGLFFVFLPVEILFIRFLPNHGFNTFFIFIGGFILSYTINYYIGMKFSSLTKKIISPKKFYSLKGYLNRFGGWAIFVINALPLPSQPLAAILGVFRYNMTRFYVFFIAGQVLKYLVIIFGYSKFM